MRAILIDPIEKKITVDPNFPGGIDAIYEFLGCRTFTCASMDLVGDTIYVDDEGLLKEGLIPAFQVPGLYPTPLAGKGIILGTDDEGGSCDAAFNDLFTGVEFGVVEGML